jgi:hypothetical protein
MLVRLTSKRFSLTIEERRLIDSHVDLHRPAAALAEVLFAVANQQVLAMLR